MLSTTTHGVTVIQLSDMKTKASLKTKNNFSLSTVLIYLFALTPIIFTSFYIPQNTFPHWAITICIASVIFLIGSVLLLYGAFKNKTYGGNILIPVFAVILSAVAVYAYVLKTTLPLSFVLFGKGVSPVSVAAIISLVPVIYFASIMKDRARIVLIISSFVAAGLPFLFSVMSRSISSATDILAKFVQPVISFDTVYAYPFWYAAAVLLGLVLGFIFELKNVAVKNVPALTKIIAIVLTCIAAGWVMHNAVRVVAGTYYVTAYNAASANDLVTAEANLRKAISIAPFDIYYLGLVDIDLAKLQSANASSSPQEISDRLVAMTQNAQAAFTYDSSNNLPLFYLYNIYKMIGLTDQEELVLNELAIRLPNNAEVKGLLKDLADAKAKAAIKAPVTTEETPTETTDSN